MVELMDGVCSTVELSKTLEIHLSYIRSQLIRMHHLGLIHPIAVREDPDEPPRFSYFQDYVWSLTTHTREHVTIEAGCFACSIREAMMGASDPVYE